MTSRLPDSSTSDSTSGSTIEAISFVSAYVDDYERAYRFYSETLGLEKSFDMSESSCFFKLGADGGLYLEGGNAAIEMYSKSVRSAFTLKVGSASALFRKLRDAGTEMIHTAPEHMGNEHYWFQFRDPAGNILEALGGA
jgi:predicted enzyme related to lactoylglutathione lyase